MNIVKLFGRDTANIKRLASQRFYYKSRTLVEPYRSIVTSEGP